ncbi:MAG: heavy metal translocating P-type ATPase [Pirellulales bacterium]
MVGVGILLVLWPEFAEHVTVILPAAVRPTLQGLGAWLCTIPYVFRAFRCTLSGDDECHSAQLMAVGLLATVATGDFLSTAIVTIVVELGHTIEDSNLLRAETALDGLRRLLPRQVAIVEEGTERPIALELLRPGQVMFVRPGDLLVADGVVTSGNTSLDTSLITGQCEMRDVGVDDAVLAGSLNLTGLIQVRILTSAADSMVGRIERVLARAISSEPGITGSIEYCAAFYLPVMLLAAAGILATTHDVSRVVAMLVVACPCALLIAAPTAAIAAIAVANRRGVVVKQVKHLEALADIGTVVFDKTGTVTTGRLTVQALVPAAADASGELLYGMKNCAAASLHPVCAAIRQYSSPGELTAAVPGGDAWEIPGKGVRCRIGQREWLLGRHSWLLELRIDLPPVPDHCGPVVAAAVDGQFLGFVLLHDAIRVGVESVVERLRELSVARIVLLTGDRAAAVAAVSRTIGFDSVITDQAPDDKYLHVREELGRSTVLFVGDGLNDAPALAAATVGMAMSQTGAEVAIRSADICLTSEDLNCIPYAICLSRRLRLVIRQNISIAVGSTVVFAGLAAGGVISPIVGAFAHHAGPLLVALNSSLFLYRELRRPLAGCGR